MSPRPAAQSGHGVLIRVRLFLCSYVPLFVIAAIRFQTPWLAIACAVLALVGALAGLSIIWSHQRLTAQEHQVASAEDYGAEVAGYLATYLLPFVTVPEPTLRDIAAYALFLLVTAVVYVRSDMLQINPTLYLVGWSVQRVRMDDGWQGYVLTRHSISPGTRIRTIRVEDTVRIERED